jgi:hypothetical protein
LCQKEGSLFAGVHQAELPTGLSEGQIAEFVEDDEVHSGEVVGEPALPP